MCVSCYINHNILLPNKKLPQEGINIHYDGTNFKITEVNLLTSMIKMFGEDGRLLEVNAKRFYQDSNNRWKIN